MQIKHGSSRVTRYSGLMFDEGLSTVCSSESASAKSAADPAKFVRSDEQMFRNSGKLAFTDNSQTWFIESGDSRGPEFAGHSTRSPELCPRGGIFRLTSTPAGIIV